MFCQFGKRKKDIWTGMHKPQLKLIWHLNLLRMYIHVYAINLHLINWDLN